MIYLDNAATTIHKPECVINAVAEAMRSLGNSGRGTHSSSLESSRSIFEAREKISEFFGCPRVENTVFTCNSTEALNIAINGAIDDGAHVISTCLEHNSVLRPLYRLEKERNVKLDFVSADKKGCIDYDSFNKLLRPETKAVVCTHASNLTGNMLDIERIGRFAREKGLLFIVDASQTAGVIPIDMKKMNIDILCFTGHKGMMGPQGTGGMCVGEAVEIKPFKVGGTGVQSYNKMQPCQLPTSLEAGTLNGHGIAGLSVAVDYINSVTSEAIHAHEEALMRRFCEALSDLEEVKMYGDFTQKRCAIVSLNIADCDSGQISDILAMDYDIATRSGAHCAPLMHEALGTVEQGAVRFSFSWNNTEEECDTAAEAVRDICRRLR